MHLTLIQCLPIHLHIKELSKELWKSALYCAVQLLFFRAVQFPTSEVTPKRMWLCKFIKFEWAEAFYLTSTTETSMGPCIDSIPVVTPCLKSRRSGLDITFLIPVNFGHITWSSFERETLQLKQTIY